MVRRYDIDFDTGGGGAVLRVPFGGRAARSRDFRIAVDLGDRIGSARWWRGLATLVAMIVAVVRLAPGIEPLPGRAEPAPSPVAERELAAIGVGAAAFGSASGRPGAPTGRAVPIASAPERARIDLSLTLNGATDLAALLARAGGAPADATQAAALVRAAAPAIPDGTAVAVTLGRRPPGALVRPIDAVTLRADLSLILTVARVGGALTLAKTPIAVDETPLRLSGAIGTSLYHAMRVAGVPLPVLADYLRAIDGHVAIDEIQPGDRFDLAIARRRAATGESENGRLLYVGMVHEGRTLALLRWPAGGQERWFDGEAPPPSREGLSLPVDGRLTSGFGMRFHPILGYSRMHQGIDLAAPEGTPIVAASDGVVRFAGWHGGHGNYVQLQHAGGLVSGYGHMSRYVVAAGMPVRRGQVIGFVGSTGLSTGPHCHFELFRGGVAVDPASADAAIVTTPVVSPEERARFRQALARFTALPA